MYVLAYLCKIQSGIFHDQAHNIQVTDFADPSVVDTVYICLLRVGSTSPVASNRAHIRYAVLVEILRDFYRTVVPY